MKNFLLLLVNIMILLSGLDVDAQKISVTFDVKNYTNDTLIIGNYYGDKNLVKDTLFSMGSGKFLWKQDTIPAPGVYLALLKPDNSYVQFLVNDKGEHFSMSFDAKDLVDVNVQGSEENQAFYGYLGFLKDKRVIADTMRARTERAKANNKTDEEAQNILGGLDKEVKKYQADIVSRFKGTIISLLIKSNIDIELPEFTGNEDSIRYKRYFYYKDHYFDNVDATHLGLIRTPFIHQKIDYYITKLSNQQPDSLNKSIDVVLKWLSPNPDAYRFYLADFLNTYAQMKMVGHDAIYVHMVDTYYSKGKATWVTQENIDKMKENADELRPILIGKKIPDITTYKEDNTPVRLYDIKSPYTVVIFWAPDCGHCKKIMPDVVSFYKNNKAKGVKMLAICTKGGENTKTCWPAIQEKSMEDFINTADEYARYNMKIRHVKTPKIFILDENKEIIVKDISGEELDRIFNEILSFEEKRKTEK